MRNLPRDVVSSRRHPSSVSASPAEGRGAFARGVANNHNYCVSSALRRSRPPNIMDLDEELTAIEPNKDLMSQDLGLFPNFSSSRMSTTTLLQSAGGSTTTERQVVYQQPDHCSNSFPTFELIRRQGKLCDVTLKVYNFFFVLILLIIFKLLMNYLFVILG